MSTNELSAQTSSHKALRYPPLKMSASSNAFVALWNRAANPGAANPGGYVYRCLNCDLVLRSIADVERHVALRHPTVGPDRGDDYQDEEQS